MTSSRKSQSAHKSRKAKARAEHQKTFNSWKNSLPSRHPPQPSNPFVMGLSLQAAAASAVTEEAICRMFGERFKP